MLLLERFYSGWGWLEIVIISVYAGFLLWNMQDPVRTPYWRILSWTIFGFVFFCQLILGILIESKFLMTGKLHLPIPAMILSGPIYRGQLSVMTILFLSTILLTGPAWCSHFCYFGAFDQLASRGKSSRKPFRNKKQIKISLLLLVIIVTIILRWLQAPIWLAVLFGVIFGLTGLIIMLTWSRKTRQMVHCTLYCPIGTLVNVIKPVNPFRLYIDRSCDFCMKCTTVCKYDSLSIVDVKNKKPNYSCTYCGDCLSVCHGNSIKYKILNLNPNLARQLYLFLTVTIHACFLALARI